MKHKDPYRIHDPNDLFEVVENSSHPELKDKRRVYHFKGYTFHTSQQLIRYFDDHGLDPRRYWIVPKQQPETDGTVTTHVNIVERVAPEERRLVRDLTRKNLVG